MQMEEVHHQAMVMQKKKKNHSMGNIPTRCAGLTTSYQKHLVEIVAWET